MRFRFFDLRDKPIQHLQDGTLIEIADLLGTISLHFPEYEDLDIELTKINFDSLNPTKLDKNWNNVFSAIVFTISGHHPSVDELNQIKSSYLDIKKTVKQNEKQLVKIVNSPEFVFGTLPYLMCAFGSSQSLANSHSSNNSTNIANIVFDLLIQHQYDVRVLLCAHRESDTVKTDSLVSNVDFIGLRKFRNVIAGILENMPLKKQGVVRMYQPSGTAYGANAVFPSIFLSFFDELEVHNLLLTLETHHRDVKAYFSQPYHHQTITYQTLPINTHIMEVNTVAEKMFGETWNSMNTQELYRLTDNNKLGEITYYMTLPIVRRLMPYYENAKELTETQIRKNIDYAKNAQAKSLIVDLASVTDLAISMFRNVMTPEGKAIYETLFYYCWGVQCAQQHAVAFGFDRDHDRFQYASFSKGYSDQQDNSPLKYQRRLSSSYAPLAYARRYRPLVNSGTLRQLSFRQFWRESDHK